MKYLLFLLILIISINIVTSQTNDMKKSFGFISFGSPLHTDMTVRENSFSISLGYQRALGNSFAWEVFLIRASANSTLDFFDDTERVRAFLNDNGLAPSAVDYSRITTYAIGGKAHLYFINNKKHNFSISAGFGYYRSESFIQRFPNFTLQSDGTISSLETLTQEDTIIKPYLILALPYTYTFRNNFSLGIEASALFDQSSDRLLTQPVIANYYNISLIFGKRF